MVNYVAVFEFSWLSLPCVPGGPPVPMAESKKNLVLESALPDLQLSLQIGADEVLIQILSTSLNPVDYKLPELGRVARSLIPLPATPGLDFCGRIVRAGRKVNSTAIGETVFGRLDPGPQGTLAEYVITKSGNYAPLPATVTVDDGAAVGTAGGTALETIEPNVKPGDKVFINGGAGGAGTIGDPDREGVRMPSA